jgi:hypothetical protein
MDYGLRIRDKPLAHQLPESNQKDAKVAKKLRPRSNRNHISGAIEWIASKDRNALWREIALLTAANKL